MPWQPPEDAVAVEPSGASQWTPPPDAEPVDAQQGSPVAPQSAPVPQPGLGQQALDLGAGVLKASWQANPLTDLPTRVTLGYTDAMGWTGPKPQAQPAASQSDQPARDPVDQWVYSHAINGTDPKVAFENAFGRPFGEQDKAVYDHYAKVADLAQRAIPGFAGRVAGSADDVAADAPPELRPDVLRATRDMLSQQQPVAQASVPAKLGESLAQGFTGLPFRAASYGNLDADQRAFRKQLQQVHEGEDPLIDQRAGLAMKPYNIAAESAQMVGPLVYSAGLGRVLGPIGRVAGMSPEVAGVVASGASAGAVFGPGAYESGYEEAKARGAGENAAMAVGGANALSTALLFANLPSLVGLGGHAKEVAAQSVREALAKYAMSVGHGTALMGSQGAADEAVQQIADAIGGRSKGTEEAAREIFKRGAASMMSSLGPMAVVAAPKGVADVRTGNAYQQGIRGQIDANLSRPTTEPRPMTPGSQEAAGVAKEKFLRNYEQSLLFLSGSRAELAANPYDGTGESYRNREAISERIRDLAGIVERDGPLYRQITNTEPAQVVAQQQPVGEVEGGKAVVPGRQQTPQGLVASFKNSYELKKAYLAAERKPAAQGPWSEWVKSQRSLGKDWAEIYDTSHEIVRQQEQAWKQADTVPTGPTSDEAQALQAKQENIASGDELLAKQDVSLRETNSKPGPYAWKPLPSPEVLKGVEDRVEVIQTSHGPYFRMKTARELAQAKEPTNADIRKEEIPVRGNEGTDGQEDSDSGPEGTGGPVPRPDGQPESGGTAAGDGSGGRVDNVPEVRGEDQSGRDGSSGGRAPDGGENAGGGNRQPGDVDWDSVAEELIGNLDSFAPARNTGRRNYDREDMVQRFVDFAKADKTGREIKDLLADFSEQDEASDSDLKKLQAAVGDYVRQSGAGVGRKPGEPEPEITTAMKRNLRHLNYSPEEIAGFKFDEAREIIHSQHKNLTPEEIKAAEDKRIDDVGAAYLRSLGIEPEAETAGAESPASKTAQPLGKEPWQMTREEYLRHADERPDTRTEAQRDSDFYRDSVTKDLAKQNIGPSSFQFEERFRNRAQQLEMPDGRTYWDVIEAGNRAEPLSHEELVKQAISEGKPVPPEVLAEYPPPKPSRRLDDKPTAVDKQVRDHSQRATIDGGNIVVTHFVGREKRGTTVVSMDEWDRANSNQDTFNPAYNKRELIRSKTLDMDEDSGGPAQADRIRDSIAAAIDKALDKQRKAKLTATEPEPAKTPTAPQEHPSRTPISEKAEQSREEAKAANKALFDYFKDRLYANPLDPQGIKLAVDGILKNLKAGYYTFREVMESFRRDFGETVALRLGPYLREAWDGLKATGVHPKMQSSMTPKLALTPDADVLKKSGLDVILQKGVGGNDRWEVTGATADNRHVLTALGGQSNGEKQATWRFQDDPTSALADALRIQGSVGTDGGSPEPKGKRRAALDEAERRRRASDERSADEYGISGDRDKYVQLSTQELIRRGSAAGIPDSILDAQIDDVARTHRAFVTGKPVHILASDPGMGKTFVTGGFIKELLDSGEKKIVYVTTSQDLIEQNRKDLRDFGADRVQFVSYAKFGEGGVDTKDAILILDESQNITNLKSQRGESAQKAMADAKFVSLASATPFRNPVDAKFLDATGAFDSEGGFVEWAKMHGAQVKTKVVDGEKVETPYWVHMGDYGVELQKAANEWFKRRGMMTQQPMQLPEGMVYTEFVPHDVPLEWVNRYHDLVGAYDQAQDGSENAGKIKMHGINVAKRILESAKVPFAIDHVRKLVDAGKQVVIYLETKADKNIGKYRMRDDATGPLYDYPQIRRMMDAWREEKKMAKAMKEPVPPPPFAPFIEEIASVLHDRGIQYEIPSTIKAFQEAFGEEKLALYTGDQSDAQATRYLSKWKAGKLPILLATMDKGGTGLSLHDTTGTMPERAMVVLNVPWTATKLDQTIGRLPRLGIKKPVTIDWLFGKNIPFEQDQSTRVGNRMRDLHAIVRGAESGKGVALGRGDIGFTEGEKPAPTPPAPPAPPDDPGFDDGPASPPSRRSPGGSGGNAAMAFEEQPGSIADNARKYAARRLDDRGNNPPPPPADTTTAAPEPPEPPKKIMASHLLAAKKALEMPDLPVFQAERNFENAKKERSMDQAEAETGQAEVAMWKLPQVERDQFIDRWEKGEAQATPELDRVAKAWMDRWTAWADAINEIRPDKLTEDERAPFYFSRGYEGSSSKEGQSWLQKTLPELFAGRPNAGYREGGKPSMMMERTLDSMKAGRELRKSLMEKAEKARREGRDEEAKELDRQAGWLKPISDNPLEMQRIRYDGATDYLRDLRLYDFADKRGWIKTQSSLQSEPGWHVPIVNGMPSSMFTIFGPPTMTMKEAYDAVQFDQIHEFGRSMGVNMSRVLNLGGKKWGVAYGDKEVVTKRNGQLAVLFHEIGHIIGTRYGLLDWMNGDPKDTNPQDVAERVQIKKEMRDLADARFKGQETTDAYKKYVRKGAEKEAVMLEALLHAPGEFQKVAPHVYKAFVRFLSENPKLKPLLDIQPSLVLGSSEYEVPIHGMRIMGYRALPNELARAVERYGSEGLRAKLQRGGVAGNVLSLGLGGLRFVQQKMLQSSLTLSAFHLTNVARKKFETYLGSMIEHGLQPWSKGSFGQAGKAAGLALASPLTIGRDILSATTGLVGSPAEQWRADRLKPDSELTPERRKQITESEKGGALLSASMTGDWQKAKVHWAKMKAPDLNAIQKGTEAAKAFFHAVMSAPEFTTKPVMRAAGDIKVGVALDLQAEWEATHQGASEDQRSVAYRKIRGDVDARFGQVNWENINMNRVSKDLAQLVFFAPGWKGGNLGALYMAARDAVKGEPGSGRHLLTGSIVHLPAVLAGTALFNTVYQYLKTGKFPWDDETELQDFFEPRTGDMNPDGTASRVASPGMERDWYALLTHPIALAQHSLNPALAAIADIYKGTDYFGTQITTPVAGEGKLQAAGRKTLDYGKHIGSKFVPLSIRNMQQLSEEGAGWKGQTQAFFGITPVPAAHTRSEASQYLLDEFGKVPRPPRTKADVERATKVIQAVKAARDSGAKRLDSKALGEYANSRQIHAAQKKLDLAPGFPTFFARSNLRQAIEAYNLATDKEKNQVAGALRKKWDSKMKTAFNDRTPEGKREYEELKALYDPIRTDVNSRGSRKLGK